MKKELNEKEELKVYENRFLRTLNYKYENEKQLNQFKVR